MLAAVVLLAIQALPAHAEIYRWIDNDGQVHFTAQPPLDVDSEQVTLPPPPPMPDPLPESPAEDASTTTSQEPVSREEAIKRNCRIARENLEKIKSEREVRVTRADGSIVTIDAAEREQLLTSTQHQIDEYCTAH